MDDDDLVELIALVEQQLEEAGLGEIADPTLYAERDRETGEPRPLPPMKRLIEMLRAFDRHLSVEDPRTYEAALKRINGSLEEGFVEDAVVIPLDGRSDPVSLADGPQVGEIRQGLEALIGRLFESYRPDDGRAS
jgi:hypothetical protein